MATVITVVDPHLPTVTADASPAATSFDPGAPPLAELDRQVRAYAELGVGGLLGLDADGLRAAVEPMRAAVAALPMTPAMTGAVTGKAEDHVPFVLVLSPEALAERGHDLDDVAPAMRRGRQRGVSVIDPEELATYRPLDDVWQPDGPFWLLHGIDTGSEFCGATPESALATVRGRGRTPLTIAEGIALTVVRPDMLRPNRCYSLMGSRAGNQRVPAVWISERRAKLGWCWDRNPHTWLGAASAAGRLGA
ncbi:DUF5701 family protein [Cellulomonas chengniuliangii]|uniref:DUF5701 family protein n=1 Tax=Cellulomonas chengniuliangii TaxID=2968084 RepID=UPI001D0F2FA7|nr:DUF5701 family protein [Cellulomonas chengniuliangii]MCC2318030.1 DUF5701 family protein [Cellulomonas chengniuliangii]